MCYDCVCACFLALCPVSPHTRQRRCRALFAGGSVGSGEGSGNGSGEDSGDDGCDDVAVSTGTGQTISCVSGVQYCLRDTVAARVISQVEE